MKENPKESFRIQDKLVTVEELSAYIGMHPITIYKFIKSGDIPAFKIGGRWRFNKQEIDAWILQKMDHNKAA